MNREEEDLHRFLSKITVVDMVIILNLKIFKYIYIK